MIYIDLLYCCVNTNSPLGETGVKHETLSIRKKDSIAKLESKELFSWEYLKRKGWICVKVEVAIEPTK